jgi:hypothetical protein
MAFGRLRAKIKQTLDIFSNFAAEKIQTLKMQKHSVMRFILFFILFLVKTSFAQNMFTSDSLPFPQNWQGTWTGKLNIYTAKGVAQTIDMALEINKIDTSSLGAYTWGMMYVSKTKDWRPYELIPVDVNKGHWKVDEKNSIVMESYLFGQKLLCEFTVEGSRILCTYEKIDAKTIVFEVMAGKDTFVSTTGNTKQGDEQISEVKTFPFSGFQRAILKKIE